MIDGGPGAEPSVPLDAWLMTDENAELMAQIRLLARQKGLQPYAGRFEKDGLVLINKPVVHTNHPSYGYVISVSGTTVAWAPEFFVFPAWTAGADLMFAEASGWDRSIRFARGVGGHLPVLAVSDAAHRHGVKRLVFAHIGRPTIRALDRGQKAPFGEFSEDGKRFRLRITPRRTIRKRSDA